MKKLPLFIVFILSVQLCFGQKINKAEYFIDSDPGFGKAVTIPVSTPAKDVSLNFLANLSGLSQGFHIIGVRARDDNGAWSMKHEQLFYLFRRVPAASPKITGLEYFIDNDPGFGKGTKVAVRVPADRVTLEFIADLTGLSSGSHILYMRARDEANRWSTIHTHAFTLNVTAIGEEIVPWFKMYPNPSEGNFVIDFDDLQRGSVKVTITDLNGRIVYSNELNGNIIPLSVDLPNGIYTLRAESGSQHFIQKLIIRR